MKITKIQNEFKIISVLTPEQIKRLEKAKQNVIYEDKKAVYGVSVTEHNPTFSDQSASFNEVSDSGKAMLTMTCDAELARNFASDEEAIAHFAEANLGAINALAEAEAKFEAALSSLDARVNEVISNVTTITVA